VDFYVVFVRVSFSDGAGPLLALLLGESGSMGLDKLIRMLGRRRIKSMVTMRIQ
jgi:hypothetical protein